MLKQKIDSSLIYGGGESFVGDLLRSTNLDDFVSGFYDRSISVADCNPELASRESRFKYERATAECHGLIKVLIGALKTIFEVIRGSSEKLKGKILYKVCQNLDPCLL